MSTFTVSYVTKSAQAVAQASTSNGTSPVTAPLVASSADLVKTIRKRGGSATDSPTDGLLSGRKASASSSSTRNFATNPDTLTIAPREDLDMKVQRKAMEIEKHHALDRFVAENKCNVTHRSTVDEAIAAKMLVMESVRFQKVNKSAVLEHTLRPDYADRLKPGCHVSTIQLMLSDVDVIMKNHAQQDNGYAAVKKSLGRIPMWGLPEKKDSLI